jgi:hypothetical protein
VEQEIIVEQDAEQQKKTMEDNKNNFIKKMPENWQDHFH